MSDDGILGGLSGSGAVEDALVRYVVRELDAGRPLADVMTDPYVTNRAGKVDSRRLLDRPEVIAAVGEDVIDDLRAKLGLL
jgi:hypothetical protein